MAVRRPRSHRHSFCALPGEHRRCGVCTTHYVSCTLLNSPYGAPPVLRREDFAPAATWSGNILIATDFTVNMNIDGP